MLSFEYLSEILKEELPEHNDALAFTDYDEQKLRENILINYTTKMLMNDDDYDFNHHVAQTQKDDFENILFELHHIKAPANIFLNLCHMINAICRAGKLIGINEAIAAAKAFPENLKSIYAINPIHMELSPIPLNFKDLAIALIYLHTNNIIITFDSPKAMKDDFKKNIDSLSLKLEEVSILDKETIIITDNIDTEIDFDDTKLDMQIIKKKLLVHLKNTEHFQVPIYDHDELESYLIVEHNKEKKLSNADKIFIKAMCKAGRLLGIGLALEALEKMLIDRKERSLGNFDLKFPTMYSFFFALIITSFSSDTDHTDNSNLVELLSLELNFAINLNYSKETIKKLTKIWTFDNDNYSNESDSEYSNNSYVSSPRIIFAKNMNEDITSDIYKLFENEEIMNSPKQSRKTLTM